LIRDSPYGKGWVGGFHNKSAMHPKPGRQQKKGRPLCILKNHLSQKPG
jgi:hypothetical protein